MKSINYFIALLCLVVLVSCSRKEESRSLYELDLVNVPVNEFPLSDLVNDIKYIPLESSDTSLISHVYGVRIREDLIIVWDYTKIFVFNWQGETERLIDKRGMGPGEYPAIIDVDIDPKNGRVVALSPKDIYSFNLDDGSFIEKTSLPGIAYSFKILNQDYYYYGCPPRGGKAYPNNNIINVSGDTIHKQVNNIVFDPGDFIVGFNNELESYRTRNGIYYKQMMNDTLFSVSIQKGFQPYAVFNTGQYRLTPEKRSYLSNQKVHELMLTDGFFETENHLFIGAVNNNQSYLAGLNKSTGEEYRFNNGIENDIDGGLPLKIIHLCNDTLLIGTALPSEIINHQPDAGFANSKFSKLKDSINENDNPVLVVYYLK